MTQIWRPTDFNGYRHGRREIAGEVRGEVGGPAGSWIFWDGIETHTLKKRYVYWDPARGIMSIPNWLVMKIYARAKRRIRNRYVPRQPSTPLEI